MARLRGGRELLGLLLGRRSCGPTPGWRRDVWPPWQEVCVLADGRSRSFLDARRVSVVPLVGLPSGNLKGDGAKGAPTPRRCCALWPWCARLALSRLAFFPRSP